MISLNWVRHRILSGVGYPFRIVERIGRSRSHTLGNDESFDAESADELAVSNTIFIGIDIALIPGQAKRLVRHLNHEQVEVGVRGSPQTVTFMISTGPTDSMLTLPCALGATEGKGTRPAERTRSNAKLFWAWAGVENNAVAAIAASAAVLI
jgi:hypothetical protein